MSGHKVFISHASENADVAERIVAYLESRGAPCWISSRDISPKEIYAEAIASAMRDAQSCVVIVSAAANASAAVKRELELASRYNKPFIPVRIDATEPGPGLDYYLNNTQWVDYGRDRERALDRILATDAPLPTKPNATRPQASTLNKGARVAAAAFVALAALSLVGVGWFLLSRPSTTTQAAQDLELADALLSGSYAWQGISCDAGPSVVRRDGAIVFSSPGTPDYNHEVIAIERDGPAHTFTVTTRVAQPVDHAGEQYRLIVKPSIYGLEVASLGRTDEWTRCGAPPETYIQTALANAPVLSVDGSVNPSMHGGVFSHFFRTELEQGARYTALLQSAQNIRDLRYDVMDAKGRMIVENGRIHEYVDAVDGGAYYFNVRRDEVTPFSAATGYVLSLRRDGRVGDPYGAP